MKKYYIYNEGYLSRSKGKFTSEFEGKKHTRNVMVYWSDFKDNYSIKQRLKYFKLTGLIHLWVIRNLNKDLNPKLIPISEEVRK